MRCTMARRSGEVSAHGVVSSHGRWATRTGAVGSSAAPPPRRQEEAQIARQRLRRRLVGGDGDERRRVAGQRRQLGAQQRLERPGRIVHAHNFLLRAQVTSDRFEAGARA